MTHLIHDPLTYRHLCVVVLYFRRWFVLFSLMESAVEPLQSLLSELEKEIVQQEAVNVALKSQALHNEERIRKMILSASRL